MQVSAIQPARSGRQNLSGVRQSIPSSSMASCAGDSITEPPGSAKRGQKKLPRSMRLVNRHSPVPSQNRIFISEAFASEDEQMTRERVLLQMFLDQRSEAIESFSHIGVAQCQMHLHACRDD